MRATMNKSRLDVLLTEYLEFLYLEGEDLSKANYVTAAVLYKVPGTKGLHALPKTQQSMKGWRRLRPPRARMPVPYEAVCLLAMAAVQVQQYQIALILLLMFHLYLRPSEPFRIRVQDIVAPVRGGKKQYKHYAILLHPNEEGVPSKALQFDEMISLDLKHQSFLGPALEKHLRLNSRKKSELAFSLEQSELVTFVESHWETLVLKPLGAPHL